MQKTKPKQDLCLIMPNNSYKISWDVFITIVLVYSCLTVTIQMALLEENLS